MNEFAVLAAVAGLVMLFVLAEIAAAVLPIIIVVALVPPGERDGLAKVIAACDSSPKLRIWSALRLAVEVRRAERARRQGDDPNLNPREDLNAAFEQARTREPTINAPRDHDPDVDRPQSRQR